MNFLLNLAFCDVLNWNLCNVFLSLTNNRYGQMSNIKILMVSEEMNTWNFEWNIHLTKSQIYNKNQ